MSTMFSPQYYNTYASAMRADKFNGLFDVDHYDRESRTWHPMTTVKGLDNARQRDDDAIRLARQSGNYDISVNDFRILLAK